MALQGEWPSGGPGRDIMLGGKGLCWGRAASLFLILAEGEHTQPLASEMPPPRL